MTDNFFRTQKKKWKRERQEFPNLDEILTCLDDGQFVASLVDKDSFNLAILLSCDVLEKIIDFTINGITLKTPEKKYLFQKDDGMPQKYSTKFETFGYSLTIGKQANLNLLKEK